MGDDTVMLLRRMRGCLRGIDRLWPGPDGKMKRLSTAGVSDARWLHFIILQHITR